MAKLPDKIKIGTRRYQIKFVEDLRSYEDEKEPLDGECREDLCISVNSDNPEVTVKSVLLHEIIHAIGYYLGDNGLTLDERRVNSLSNMLFEIMTENPTVRDYIFHK
jgi:hypothetical protein